MMTGGTSSQWISWGPDELWESHGWGGNFWGTRGDVDRFCVPGTGWIHQGLRWVYYYGTPPVLPMPILAQVGFSDILRYVDTVIPLA